MGEHIVELWKIGHKILPLGWAWGNPDLQLQLSPKMTLIGENELGRVAHERVPKRNIQT